MHIVILCATWRGYLFLKKLFELAPSHGIIEVSVFSFKEEPWEPLFLDSIRALTLNQNGQCFEAKNLESLSSFWESTQVDLILVVSWRYIVSSKISQKARLGTFVFHDSLLPKYRGFSPTVWAILNGEKQTGVSLFEMTEKFDAGSIVTQASLPIHEDDSIAIVMEKVTELYLSLLEKNLSGLLSGTAPRLAQDHSIATYTCKRLPEDNLIDWKNSTTDIYNLIRAVSPPYPGAYTYLNSKKLVVLAAQRIEGYQYVGKVPGRVVQILPGQGSVVLTGDGYLMITKVMLESGAVTSAADVLTSLSQTLREKPY